jgi:hypothetical protein
MANCDAEPYKSRRCRHISSAAGPFETSWTYMHRYMYLRTRKERNRANSLEHHERIDSGQSWGLLLLLLNKADGSCQPRLLHCCMYISSSMYIHSYVPMYVDADVDVDVYIYMYLQGKLVCIKLANWRGSCRHYWPRRLGRTSSLSA